MFLLKENYWEIKETKNKGRGIFAKKLIPAGTIIGDYIGKLVHLKDIDFEREKKNLYFMYYDDETGIYPDLKKPGIHLLNHSCSPNCWVYKFKRHTIVFALKNIQKNEELSISYLLPPKISCNNCTHDCCCGNAICTGSMHLSDEKYKKWRIFQDKEEKKEKTEKVKNKKALTPLIKYPKFISKSYIIKIKNLGVI